MKSVSSKHIVLFLASALVLGLGLPALGKTIDSEELRAVEAVAAHSVGAETQILSNMANEKTDPLNSVAISMKSKTSQIDIPWDPKSPIMAVTAHAKKLALRLPFDSSAHVAKEISPGVLSFGNQNGSSSLSVVKADGSLQMATVITSASAPRNYRYSFELQGGWQMIENENGSVAIFDDNGVWAAGVAPAWAKDAVGRDVQTSYEVIGSDLIQNVNLDDPAIQYPVVADPWLGFDLIDHDSWIYTWAYSPTLAVYPTIWGRTVTPLANGAAWDETLSKVYPLPRVNPDTPTMQVQFDCHFQAVRVREPNKTSWDLDVRLPWTDFATEVRYGCNYYPGATPQF